MRQHYIKSNTHPLYIERYLFLGGGSDGFEIFLMLSSTIRPPAWNLVELENRDKTRDSVITFRQRVKIFPLLCILSLQFVEDFLDTYFGGEFFADANLEGNKPGLASAAARSSSALSRSSSRS
jgi:hypothetical protein